MPVETEEEKKTGRLGKVTRPNERWGTDLMYLSIGSRTYYLVTFMDEYSRYLVHHELLTSMYGKSLGSAAQAAIEKLPREGNGLPLEKPQICSDNGSDYISKEFWVVVAVNQMMHLRIRPHCPEEYGLVERCNRTLREALEDAPMEDWKTAQNTIGRVYNQ